MPDNNSSDIEQLRSLIFGTQIQTFEEKITSLHHTINHIHTKIENLKETILAEECKALNILEEKLNALAVTMEELKITNDKTTPSFNDMFLAQLQHEDKKTIEIIAQYLPQILQESNQTNHQELNQILTPFISPIVSTEIQKSKETMIDMLYPVMGGMISKYVLQAIKEMTQTINKKIEKGLSLGTLKRKIKAKITGVSETELLLKESNDASISLLFIIEKESGMLISEAHLENQEINEPHMVASMASAIKDFINDWVQSNETHNEVQLLSYANATLYIESAGSVYIIAFLDTEPDYEIRQDINTFFASLVQEYANFFQNFNGDDSSKEVTQLSQKMHTYLNNQESVINPIVEEKKSPLKYILFFIGLFILLNIGLYIKEAYFLYQLEQKVEKQTGYHVKIEKKEHQFILIGEVRSFKDAKKIDSIIKKVHKISIINTLSMPLIQVEEEILKAQEYSHHILIEKLGKLSNSNKNTQQLEERIMQKLHYYDQKLEEITQKQTSVKRLLDVKNEIVKNLLTVFSNNPFFNTKEGSLDFSQGNIFGANNSVLHPKVKITIKENFEAYITLLLSNKEIKKYIKAIIIEGHTDSSGYSWRNIELSQNRAKEVKEYLLSLKIAKTFHLKPLLISKGLSSSQAIFKNGVEDKKASRRIKIKFILDTDKITKEIGKILK